MAPHAHAPNLACNQWGREHGEGVSVECRRSAGQSALKGSFQLQAGGLELTHQTTPNRQFNGTAPKPTAAPMGPAAGQRPQLHSTAVHSCTAPFSRTVLAEEVGEGVQGGIKGEGRGVDGARVHLTRHLRPEIEGRQLMSECMHRRGAGGATGSSERFVPCRSLGAG